MIVLGTSDQATQFCSLCVFIAASTAASHARQSGRRCLPRPIASARAEARKADTCGRATLDVRLLFQAEPLFWALLSLIRDPHFLQNDRGDAATSLAASFFPRVPDWHDATPRQQHHHFCRLDASHHYFDSSYQHFIPWVAGRNAWHTRLLLEISSRVHIT